MKKKVVLYAPLTSTVQEQKHPPMALLAISRLLYQNDYEIVIVTRHEKNYKEKIIKELEDSICLGITSLTGYQIKDGLDIASLAKKTYPNKPIIWGGWHPSILPKQTIKHPLVDIIVYGQGEKTFFELTEAIHKNEKIKNTPGLVFTDENGEVIKTSPRENENLDNFPPLPYELLNMDRFFINSEIGSRSTYYFTSQGCPHRCGFCADKLVYHRKWNALSAKRVVEEIKDIVQKYKVNALFISDTNFFVDENRVVDICKGLINQGIKVNLGYINGRADQLNKYRKETFELMRKAGIRSILIGAESPTKEILDYITKDEDIEEIIKITKRCKNYGIKIYFSFIIGFPARKEEEKRNYNKLLEKEFNDILDFIDKLMEIEKNNVFAICLYTPYPGTPLYEKSKENGFIAPKSLEEWANFDIDKKTTPWLPKKYQKITEQFNLFYFQIMSDNVYNIYKDSLIFRILYRILYSMLTTRWKYRFFHIPLEYYLMKILLKTKMKLYN